MNGRGVCVTGLGVVSPFGLGADTFWQGLLDGRSVIRNVPESVAPGRSRIAGCIPEHVLEQAQHVWPGKDPVLAYALFAADEALLASGLDSSLPSERRSVVMGTAVGGVVSMERAFRASLKGEACREDGLRHGTLPADLYGNFCAYSLAQLVAERAAAQGLVTCVSTGCTAGLDALGIALDLIQTNHADVVLAGASEAPLTPIVISAFDNVGALSRRNEDAATASRPFSCGRDGFVIGEGAAVLVLESAEHALRRNARVLALLSSYASNSNAFHMTSLSPDGVWLSRCMEDAIQRAGLSLEAVGHVNAHGTSTPQNDIAETNAIHAAFGSRACRIPVSSPKSMIGHSLGAASAMACCAVVRSLTDQVIHPTANLNPDDGCDLDYVPEARVPSRPLQHVMCNASGFSGIHSSVIFSASTL